MKLLLTSGGLMNQSILKALDDLMGVPRSQFRIAFIPTAANVEEGDKGSWLVKDYNYFCDLKPAVFDIVDLSAVPRDIWQPRLESANILVFGGGNTFHMMYWLNKSDLIKFLPNLLKNKVYVGISAGSVIAGPSMKLSPDPRIYSKSIPETKTDSCLNLVRFQIIPHMNSPHFSQMRDKKYLEKLTSSVKVPVYALDDQSAIKVDGDKIEVVSEGEYLIINQGKTTNDRQ